MNVGIIIIVLIAAGVLMVAVGAIKQQHRHNKSPKPAEAAEWAMSTGILVLTVGAVIGGGVGLYTLGSGAVRSLIPTSDSIPVGTGSVQIPDLNLSGVSGGDENPAPTQTGGAYEFPAAPK